MRVLCAGAAVLTACQRCGESPDAEQPAPEVAGAAAPSPASASLPRLAVPSAEQLAPLERLLEASRRGGGSTVRYRAPTPEQAQEFGRWAAAVVVQAGGATEKAPFSCPGSWPGSADWCEISCTRAAPRDDLLALTESGAERCGSGAVIVRHGGGRPFVVELPHTFYDTGTLPLGVRLFEALEARVLLVNTVHRYGRSGAEPTDTASESDVAHAEVSLFNGVHEALLAAEPQLVTIQLHGFADSSVKGVDMVVSAARTKLSVAPLAARLQAALRPAVVKAYPHEVRQLGGTTNRQAAASRRHGAELLHLELSGKLRQRLKTEPALVARIAEALLPLRAP